MAHKVITDTHIFPRMNRDVIRHRERMRQAIKRNLEAVVANENIITTEKGKVVRIPIHQLREWHFAFEEREPMVGHGDGRKKVPCPACSGSGYEGNGGVCDPCDGIGIVTSRRARRIREWLYEQEHGPTMLGSISMTFDPDLVSEMARRPDKSEDEEEKRRRGATGRPRSKSGDRILREKKGGADGERGGDKPGVDIYETEITIEELANIVFDALELPDLENRGKRKIRSEVYHFDDIRKAGPMSSIERKRTVRANMERNAKEIGRAVIRGIERKDIRYQTWEIEEEEEAAAVVMAIMDTSGSMTEFKKFICRTFFSWMVRFLRTQYKQVEIVFIAHHTEAKEVNETDFFHKVESGGTMMSSGWAKALQILKERFSPTDWNVYVFHFSDGENFPNDNDDLISGIRSILDYPANMVGYGEVTAQDPDDRWPFWASPTQVKEILQKVFAGERRFVVAEIKKQGDVWPALQTFFSRDAKTSQALDDLVTEEEAP
jgi:hypothetical protein